MDKVYAKFKANNRLTFAYRCNDGDCHGWAFKIDGSDNEIVLWKRVFYKLDSNNHGSYYNLYFVNSYLNYKNEDDYDFDNIIWPLMNKYQNKFNLKDFTEENVIDITKYLESIDKFLEEIFKLDRKGK